ncbi:MAG TPA: hypothetical protein VM536_20575 [Chloroflexia bacterium]|nr:hypothetical protein [Chloroflexia bacterium]
MKGFKFSTLASVAFVGGVGWMLLAPHATAAGVSAQTNPTTATVDVGTLLGPLVASATAIQQVITMFWNWVESGAQQMVAALGLGRSWATYAQEEIHAAEGALSQLAAEARRLRHVAPNGPPTNPLVMEALDARINTAQQKLGDAQQQMRNALKSERYKSIKQGISVLASLVLGLIVATVTQLNMFALLNLPNNGGLFGVLITGLIIGAGTGPVHSIIGLLQQTRDAVDQAANLLSSGSKRNASQAIATLMTANAAAGGTAVAGADAVGTRGLGIGPPAGPVTPGVTQEQLRAIERMAHR